MNKKSIPVIGVPIVNGVHWLKKLILSIDYPVDNLFIINNNGRGEINEELEELKKEFEDNIFIKNFYISHFPSNLGCSVSWNLIIKSYLMEPYWVICSHDVSFTPGLLEEIVIAAEDKEVAMIHPHAANFNLGSYDLFVITEKGVKTIGLFDENLYPAYGEDVDFIMRIHNLQPKMIKGLKNIHKHGNDIAKANDEHYWANAQQTAKEEPKVGEQLELVNKINFTYLEEKWGKSYNLVSPHWNPFQNPEFPQSYTTFDLDFVRKKYLAF